MTQGCGGMAKEDFREKIEEHRQPIQLDEEQGVPSRKSRMDKRGKSTKKTHKQATTKTKSPFITIVLALFILIPSSAFIYVYFWDPSSGAGTEVVQDKDVVEVQTNDVGTTSNESNATPTNEPTQTEKNTEQSTNQQTDNNTTQQTPIQQGEQMYTVEKNDSLYKISVKYYGDGSGIDKIKEANGLTSEAIAVGQTLIIPE